MDALSSATAPPSASGVGKNAGDARPSTTARPSTSSGKSQGTASPPAKVPNAYEIDHAASEYALAEDYYYGRNGRPKNDAEALKWYRQAAEHGNAAGQVRLGFMYANGRGLAKDDVEAVKWYRKAVEQGNARGQVNLGNMYEQGRGGLTKDRAHALTLYRQAMAQGNDDAKEALKRIGEN